jgi:hypothetical protein
MGHTVKPELAPTLASMAQSEIDVACANCGRPGRVGGTLENGWRYFRDGVGELVLFCALCVRLGSRPDAPASTEETNQGRH